MSSASVPSLRRVQVEIVRPERLGDHGAMHRIVIGDEDRLASPDRPFHHRDLR